jgi:hypothetical protein
MDTKDAWLLFAGTILGFVTNLLSTFAAPSLGSAFGKLKSGFIERNKAKALASYLDVHDLKTGKNKYLYAINHWGSFSLMLLVGSMGGIMEIVSRKALGPPSSPMHQESLVLWFFLVTGLVLLVLILRRTLRVFLNLSRSAEFRSVPSPVAQPLA